MTYNQTAQVMTHDFSVLRTGITVQTFDVYDDVRTLVSRLHPQAHYCSWAPQFDGRLWREVHVSGQYVLAIRTRLSAQEFSQAGAE